LFETDTDCLFGVSARRPHTGFNYFSTRPQALSLFILVVLVNIAESNLILHAPQQHETLLNSLDRSEGSQRASRGGESLVAHVDGYRSVLNAYDTGKEAKTLLSSLNRSEGSQRVLRGGESLVVRVNGYRSILNTYDAGREAI
jgi:hypothetical protein